MNHEGTHEAHPSSDHESTVGQATSDNDQPDVGSKSSFKEKHEITPNTLVEPQGSRNVYEDQMSDIASLARQGASPEEHQLDQDTPAQQLVDSASGQKTSEPDHRQTHAPSPHRAKAANTKKPQTLAQLIDSASEEENQQCDDIQTPESDGEEASNRQRRRRRSAAEMLAAATQKLMGTPYFASLGNSVAVTESKNIPTKRPADDCPLVQSPVKKRSQRIRGQDNDSGPDTGEQNLAAQVPRKRGRPPKLQTASTPKLATKAVTKEPPKKRGRPPKVKKSIVDVESLPEVVTASAAAVQSGGVYDVPVTPKKRGRPKKVTTAPKLPATTAAPTPEASPAGPKRRGRPPKVKG